MATQAERFTSGESAHTSQPQEQNLTMAEKTERMRSLNEAILKNLQSLEGVCDKNRNSCPGRQTKLYLSIILGLIQDRQKYAQEVSLSAQVRKDSDRILFLTEVVAHIRDTDSVDIELIDEIKKILA